MIGERKIRSGKNIKPKKKPSPNGFTCCCLNVAICVYLITKLHWIYLFLFFCCSFFFFSMIKQKRVGICDIIMFNFFSFKICQIWEVYVAEVSMRQFLNSMLLWIQRWIFCFLHCVCWYWILSGYVSLFKLYAYYCVRHVSVLFIVLRLPIHV